MFKIVCFLALIWSAGFSKEIGTWKIELFDGKAIKSNTINIENNRVILSDTTIQKSDVKNILFLRQGSGISKGTAKEDITKILNEARALEKLYPDAGGIILKDDDKYILNPDGTRKYEYHFIGKIMKNSQKRWATVRLYFEEDRSKINVTLARTIKSDGTIYNLSKNAIKIIKPKSGTVFFEKGKSIQFEIPNVSVGDIIEYKFTEEIFNPWNKKIFNVDHYFQSTEPVGESSLSIGIPSSQTLTIGTRNITTMNDTTYTKNGYRYYFWQMKNLKPVIEEPKMPPLGNVIPRIEVSNLHSWKPIFKWYKGFQLSRMVITEHIKTLADSLTKKAKTQEEKVAKLYHFVQRNVRYISIKGGAASGVSGHPAEETLQKGYGDCTDKAILFATMLRAVGVKAYPVYIGTNGSIPTLMPEVPGYYGNHCIDYVEVGNKHLYLDATGTTSRYPSYWSADHDVYAINAIKEKIEKTPIPPPKDNQRYYKYEISISPSLECTVVFTAHYSGDWEDWLRWYWQHKKQNEIRKTFEEMIHEVSPYAELIDYSLKNVDNISQPFELSIKYKLINYIKETKDLYLFELPELVDRYTFDEVSLAKRQYPISYSTSEEIRDSYRITFPKNLKIVYTPEKTDLSYHTGKGKLCITYHASYDYNGNNLTFSDDFKRFIRIISPADYANYKNTLTNISLFTKKKVVLKER